MVKRVVENTVAAPKNGRAVGVRREGEPDRPHLFEVRIDQTRVAAAAVGGELKRSEQAPGTRVRQIRVEVGRIVARFFAWLIDRPAKPKVQRKLLVHLEVILHEESVIIRVELRRVRKDRQVGRVDLSQQEACEGKAILRRQSTVRTRSGLIRGEIEDSARRVVRDVVVLNLPVLPTDRKGRGSLRVYYAARKKQGPSA
jgi:hypothetical protein